MKPSVKPMAHQSAFLRAARGKGGIIAAHGTGTGKTLSGVAAFEEAQARGEVKRALVVVPAGLKDNFVRKGVQRFTTSKAVVMSRPGTVAPDAEYVVVSYAAFRRDPQAWLDTVKPDVLIADEVHKAANPESANFRALAKARPQVKKFIGLTASITQNEVSEIAPLLRLARGDGAVPSKSQFRKKHVKKQLSKKKRGVFGGKVYEPDLVGEQDLSRLVGQTVHYVEDLDASKKPRKEVSTVEVPMSNEQLSLYRQSMKGVDPRIQRKISVGGLLTRKERMNIFTRLLRARQVSNSVHTLSPGMSLEDAAAKTPKIRRIIDDAVEHLDTTKDGQVIMYTNMVHGGVDVLKAELDKRGIKHGVFAGAGKGGVTKMSRAMAVEDYLAGRKRVIIITGAGAEGLSLGNTTMVQMVDGHYNPERMSQAEARGIRAGGLAHRKVENRKVAVKRYVSTVPRGFWKAVTFRPAERSVEQFVYETANRKKRMNTKLRAVLARRTEHEQKKRQSLLYRLSSKEPS